MNSLRALVHGEDGVADMPLVDLALYSSLAIDAPVSHASPIGVGWSSAEILAPLPKNT